MLLSLRKAEDYAKKLIVRISAYLCMFFNITFVEIYQARIGHFVLNVEILLSDIDCRVGSLKKSRKIFYYFYHEIVSNNQIKKMWLRTLPIINHKVGKLVNEELEKITKNKIDWKNTWIRNVHFGDVDKYRSLRKCNSHLKFTNKEIKTGEELIEKLGIKSPFVCLLVRDSEYLKNIGGKYRTKRIEEQNKYRDCDINSYNKAVEWLLDNNFSVIRMGKWSKQKYQIKHDRFMDYSKSPYRSDFMDIYLIYKCKFFITTGTGLDAVASAFRKPLLYTNYLPYLMFSSHNDNILIIFKKLFDINSGEMLSINEILNREAELLLQTNQYVNKNIFIKNNSEKELLEATKEMVELAINKKPIIDSHKRLQEQFLSEIGKSDHFADVHTGVSNIYSKIGYHFLQSNKELLNKYQTKSFI